MGRSKNGGLGFGISFGSQGNLSQINLDNKVDSLTKKRKSEVCYDRVGSTNNCYCQAKFQQKGSFEFQQF